MNKVCYFVTGTDTGVGKTLISAALLRALAQRYPRVVGMKPVAAGGDEDIAALRAASTVQVAPNLDNPVNLPEPLSPHIAARTAGREIDIPHLVQCQRTLLELADAVVVEGAGGFFAPLTDSETATETIADLACSIRAPVILVVGMRLGCLNHALLTAQAIAARGLTLAGWVANRIDPAMQAQDENVEFLQRHLNAPLLTDVGFKVNKNMIEIKFKQNFV